MRPANRGNNFSGHSVITRIYCFRCVCMTLDFIVWAGPDFAGGGSGANIEDGSSLIIHWSSGSHKRSTNWANQYDIYFRNSIVCMAFSTLVPSPQTSLLHQHVATKNKDKQKMYNFGGGPTGGGPGPWPPWPPKSGPVFECLYAIINAMGQRVTALDPLPALVHRLADKQTNKPGQIHNHHLGGGKIIKTFITSKSSQVKLIYSNIKLSENL